MLGIAGMHGLLYRTVTHSTNVYSTIAIHAVEPPNWGQHI